MTSSVVWRICLVCLVACWGLLCLQALAAQAQGTVAPTAAQSGAGEKTAQSAEESKSAAELAGLQETLKSLRRALTTKRQEFAPQIREAQINVQQATAALQRAIGPDESKTLEDELRLAQESLALLERELTLAEDQVAVAEGRLAIAEKRAIQSPAEEPLRSEDQPLTTQAARVAHEEAQLAGEKASLAKSKAEALQTGLHQLEQEIAERQTMITAIEQEIAAVTQKFASHSGGEERDRLERQLRQAQRRAAMLQKHSALAQQELDLVRGKLEIAEGEHELLSINVERLEARARTIRDSVGVTLDDIKADQQQAIAAQRSAETEKQKAQQQQSTAQKERDSAEQALAQAKIAREQAKTPEHVRLADLMHLAAEQRVELAQRKTELTRDKIDVAERAAQLAQKRLEITSFQLEAGRRALTATDVLGTYEWAKSEAARAAKDARSARASAELATQELESLLREAELAQLKVQVERTHADRARTEPLTREIFRALEENARVAQERAQVAEQRAGVVQDRARIADEKAQLLHDFEAELAVQRSTYQLWKREPSKITWDILEEVSSDLVWLRSALIIAVSTLPEQLNHLRHYLSEPGRLGTILAHSVAVFLLVLLAVFSGRSLQQKLQPLIVRQESLFLPSAGQRLLRAAVRLLAAMALPAMLFLTSVMLVWFVGDSMLLTVGAIILGGFTAYSFLRGVLRELFMPWDPSQRLLACRNGVASYLYPHLRRISVYLTVFLTVLIILRVVHYHEGLIALLKVAFYLGLLVLLVLLTSNKAAFLGLLPNAQNRLEKLIYVAATQVYPLFILLAICIIALQGLGYVNLAHFLLRAALLSAALLTAAHFAVKGINKILRWWLLAEGHAERDFLFGRQTTETFYTILSHAAGFVAYLAAIVMIAGTWGVDLSGIYTMLTSPTVQDYLGRLLTAIVVVIISAVILRTAYYLIDRVFDVSPEEARAWRKKIALGDKGRTVAPLLKSMLKYGTIFIAGVLVLRALGVDPTPIIAGAGVVGLAVGFGAQTLVKDVISGFFLLFEGLIAVGDAISFGNSAGVVEEVGLRVTKYRTFSGELWVIPNGEIRAFGNSNRQWMRAVVAVAVAYEQDVGKAMHVLEEVGKTWAAEHPSIVLEPPQVQGILSFDESSITLRLAVKVRPSQQGAAEWELRRRIKDAFDHERIEIPFPRRVYYTRKDVSGLNGEEEGLPRPTTRGQKVDEALPSRARGSSRSPR